MAALVKSAVVQVERLSIGQQLARRQFSRTFVLTLTGQGTVANSIDAATLGLGKSKITSCSNATATDNSLIVLAVPSFDGTKILLKAAGANTPADYTGTFRITVFAK